MRVLNFGSLNLDYVYAWIILCSREKPWPPSPVM